MLCTPKKPEETIWYHRFTRKDANGIAVGFERVSIIPMLFVGFSGCVLDFSMTYAGETGETDENADIERGTDGENAICPHECISNRLCTKELGGTADVTLICTNKKDVCCIPPSGAGLGTDTDTNTDVDTGTDTDTEPGAPGDLVLIDVSGTPFTMGSSDDEPGRGADEEQHEVRLTRNFWIQTTEVTQDQYYKMMNDRPSYHSDCGGTCPVEQVTWHMAAAYCNALSVAKLLEKCYDCTGSGRSVVCAPSTSFATPYDC